MISILKDVMGPIYPDIPRIYTAVAVGVIHILVVQFDELSQGGAFHNVNVLEALRSFLSIASHLGGKLLVELTLEGIEHSNSNRV